jgi:hypothetical protein
MQNTPQRRALRLAAVQNEGAKLHWKVARSRTRGLSKFKWDDAKCGGPYSPHIPKYTDEDARGEFFDKLKASGFYVQGDPVDFLFAAKRPAHGRGIDAATRGRKL